MEIKKILWAYDGSDHSKHALKYAEFFSGHFGAEIHGIHVYSIPMPVNPYYAPYVYDVAEKTEKRYSSELEDISAEQKKKGIDFKSEIIRGGTAAEIVRYADEKDMDLIIMGITPRGFLGSMLVESTSIEVLRNTKKPVLITKSSQKNRDVNLKKILVPIDIGEKIPAAVETALYLAAKEGSHVTVLYVMNIAFQVYEVPEKIISEIVEETTRDLKNFVNSVTESSESLDNDKERLSVLPKVIFGMNPAAKVSDYARRNNFDLVVVNSQGKGAFKRFLLGSVAEQIARETLSPVMVVKPGSDTDSDNK